MKQQLPTAIYLQWHGADKRELLRDELESGPDLHQDVTWCEDKIFDTDVRYVLDKRHKRPRNK